MERREVRVEEGAAMGRRNQIREARGRALWRVLLAASSAAVFALVALPTGATAHPRVPPPACPSELTLQAIERAPGGVILTGTVTNTTQTPGRVALTVDSWYHRSPVRGIASGVLPATVDLAPGPTPAASGARGWVPIVGTRVLVAGTWDSVWQSVSVGCGVLATVDSRIGQDWLAKVEARHVAVAPTSGQAPPRLPLDAPWFILGLGALALFVASAFFSALADARDPLPAT